MDGLEYEQFCAKYIENKGFTSVIVTDSGGDQGVDVIGYKDGEKYAFQCKYYEGSVGNKAVQEVFSGARFYDCTKAVVITNSKFTNSARELAYKIGVAKTIKAACEKEKQAYGQWKESCSKQFR
ncbi:MAG: restriction endonuclease [Eubacterium sp.]|nr:restriction endonuclease [Eubacterium sp.]